MAALLPNLSQIRRPSKSAIVNSSIAHVHASRRHRLLASRELRILKAEADALRQEVNEWRHRAAWPRLEEPVRSEGFGTVLSGDLDLFATPACANGAMEEDEGAFDGLDEGDEDYVPPPCSAISIEDEDAMTARGSAVLKTANAIPFGTIHDGSAMSTELGIPPVMVRGGPAIAQMPSSVSFENPVMPSMYEPHSHYGTMAYTMEQHQHYHQYRQGPQHPSGPKWAPDVTYPATMQYPVPQRATVTPPTQIEHGHTIANMKTNQHLFGLHQHPQSQQMTYSVIGGMSDADDTSSVGSHRSGSGMSNKDGGYVSPGRYEAYDMGGSPHGVGGGMMMTPVVSNGGYGIM